MNNNESSNRLSSDDCFFVGYEFDTKTQQLSLVVEWPKGQPDEECIKGTVNLMNNVQKGGLYEFSATMIEHMIEQYIVASDQRELTPEENSTLNVLMEVFGKLTSEETKQEEQIEEDKSYIDPRAVLKGRHLYG